MDCECSKERKSVWPEAHDLTGETLLHEEDSLFNKIINRRDYEYSDDEDDLFLEELTTSIRPTEKVKNTEKSDKEDDFLDELRTDKYVIEDKDEQDKHIKEYDAKKEEQIINKLHKLKA